MNARSFPSAPDRTDARAKGSPFRERLPQPREARLALLVGVGTSLLFFLASGPTHLGAQTGRIEGTVLEAETDQPLEGVTVRLEETELGTFSSARGSFALSDVPVGGYVVVAEGLGYQAERREITVRRDATTRLTVRLSTEAVEVGGITVEAERRYVRDVSVSGLKIATPVLETGRSLSLVAGELLQEQGAFTKKDLYRNVAGLSEFAFNNDVTLRGFRVSSPTLYNGLRGNPFGMFHLDPKLTNIDHVEVLKGPAGVLYGALPPGGLINMVTRTPQPRASREITARAGSFDRYNLSGHFTGPLVDDELLYRIDAELEDTESFRDNQSSDFINVVGALSWRPDERTTLTFEGGVFDETLEGRRERGIPFFDDDVFFVPISFTSHERTDFFKNEALYAELRFDRSFGRDVSVNAGFRYYDNDAREAYHEPRGIRADETDRDGDGNTEELVMMRRFRSADREREGVSLNANVVWRPRTGPVEHTLLVGGDVLREESVVPRFQRALSELEGGDVPVIEVFRPVYNPGLSDTYRMGAFVPGGYQLGARRQFGQESFRTGLYVQDEVRIGRLNLSAAVRLDTFDDEDAFGEDDFRDEEFTIRGGALYRLFDGWSVYGSYSEGYEPQNLSNQDAATGGPFDPEESWQVEFGTKTSLFEDRLLATLAFYQITKENVLVRDPDDLDRLVALGEVESQGVEVEVTGELTPRWRISGNYAFNDIEVTRDTDPEQVGRNFPNAPQDQGGVWTTYSFLEGDLGLGGGLEFVGERETFAGPPNLPSYTTLDATAWYRWNDLVIRLNVDNLTDKRYLTGGFGGRNGGLPGAPRNIQISTTFSF